MAIRTYKVTLDSKNAIAPEPVFLRQGDKTGAVVIDAKLMDNGAPVSLDGLTPMFKANTADGQAVIADSTGFNIVNSSGGEFTYQVPSQLGSVDGKIKIAYFSFSDSSGSQSTFNVVFVVEKAADMTQESAKDWVSTLSEIIEQYNQWSNDAHNSWEQFVNDNKAIIESIDPGGKVLSELIGFRHSDMLSKTFDTAKLRGDFFDQEFSNRGINVKWFGAKGDGNTDDTTAIQSAIDSLKNGDTLFFEKNKIYKTAGINLHNLTNVKIFGHNSTLSITDGTDNFAFQYTGKNSEIELAYFKIVGNMAGGKITAIGCHSGQDLTYSNIHDLTIDHVNVGISLNAEMAGTIAFNNVFNNHLTNIIGSEPGSGYGVHIANADFNSIHDNVIDHAQRHSIYHAFGDNNDIYHNKILNHRADINEGVGRAALQILRSSSNVRVYDNNFIKCYDGCIIMNTLNELGDMLNIDIFNNNFISPQGIVPVIRVGGDETELVYKIFNIKIHQNNFQSDALPTAIRLDDGIGVFIENNNIDYLNLTDRVNGMLISPTVSGALDRVFINNNIFRINGSNYKDFRGIYFGGLVPTDSNVHITAHDNLFPTIYSDIEKKFSDYSANVTITNPNIMFRNDMKRIAEPSTMPPSTGFYPLGSLCWSSNPNLTGCVGWVCVVEGNPGTWMKFGALIS